MEKRIKVYYQDEATPLGTVFVSSLRGKEVYSFAYDETYLASGYQNLLLDSEIAWIRGRQYKADPSKPYRFLQDSSPDRWGRNLIRRAAVTKTLFESDFLLGVSDIARMGALRYKLDDGASFLGQSEDIPPYEFIGALEDAAFHYEEGESLSEWKILLSPGSSLGGARPKACIYGNDGKIYLAKFGHRNDDYDVPSVEYFTYLLAKEAGLRMAPSKHLKLGQKRSVFLTERFDREQGKRIHYASFMTILGAEEGDSGSHSFLEIAESITRLSADPRADLEELFRRVAFFLIVGNYDDHLRNHGMVFASGKWRLSPCFDVNIVPYASEFALPINGSGPNDLGSLIQDAPFYGLSTVQALSIIDETIEAVERGRTKYAKQCGLSPDFGDKG